VTPPLTPDAIAAALPRCKHLFSIRHYLEVRPGLEFVMTAHVNIGNAGEHLIMVELLFRGCHAFMADRGNPAFDLTAILLDNRQVKIRVKTCSSNRTIQYNARKSGGVFLQLSTGTTRISWPW
jgi:hypothetical protein